jgi:glycosyltransferase involved in cell wall biosynthesis
MAAEAERMGTVAIVHPQGHIRSNPTIQSMISFLAERGHDVHLISLNRPRDDAGGFTSRALRGKHPWLATRWGRPLSRFWMPIFVWLEARRTHTGVVIVVDTPGALAAAVSVRSTHALHLYLSLHMESLADVAQRRRYGPVVRRLLERRILGHMDALITQDDYRRRQLQNENGLEAASIPCFLVPNSHRGRARRHTSTFYQQKLGLPRDEPVVLVAGTIGADWSHTEFLAECAASQDPPFYTLVMQSREPLAGSELRKLSALCHSRAVLSPEPVPAAEVGSAFGSATVGAAIYTNTFHWNQTFVGGASGKMMSYLQAGVPVIMLDSPGVTEVIREFDCGEVLSGLDCDEFNNLVRKIASDHRRYSVNAERCYNEKYEFDQAFSAVHRFMIRQDDRRPWV